MRRTIRGLIIKNKKILLVTGHGADFYWTPGGGVEPGEEPEDTLRRELNEELGVRMLTFVPHSLYEYENQRVENFLVEIEGSIKPSNEITGAAWYYSNSKIKLSNGFKNTVLPRLIKEGLVE